MRLLYLTYGTHSGIVTSHVDGLRRLGVEVQTFDAAAGFDFRMRAVRLPSPHPANIWNSLVAMKRYGREWRWFFRRTDFAFRWMSRRARSFWRRHESRFDVVMQSGALFNGDLGGERRKAPFVMHLDHTYALSKQAPPVEGLRDANPASRRWEAMESETYAAADLIFTMSECVKMSLTDDYAIPAERVRVLGGGPNFAEMPDVNGERAPGPVVLFVGKDFPRKGGPVVLEAFAKVREEMPEARLLVVGPKEVPSAPGVTCLGLRTHAEMPPIYAQSRVFVMPSWREPYGIAFIEAMAYGLPCVGSRIEAIPEIIDEARTGLLVAPGDVSGLAQAMTGLLRDEKRCAEMGAAGRKKVEDVLNWDRVTRSMLDELRAIVESKSG